MRRGVSLKAAWKALAIPAAAAMQLCYEGRVKNAIAIRHVSFEDAGILEDVLAARGVGLRYLDAGVDDLAPAKDADILIVLGGPIGVTEFVRYPFLRDEFAVIEHTLRRKVPLIGICLGAQAIAAALGARVYKGRGKEIGWGLISLTAAGRDSPLAALAENKMRVLHWHGDTFDMPSGAKHLAETAITPNQAFSYGPKVLALQFHVEPRARHIERWLIGHTSDLRSAGINLAQLRADTKTYGEGLERAGTKLFSDWLDKAG
jgi:GMP synthase (glutamine-hydrolysing)